MCVSALSHFFSFVCVIGGGGVMEVVQYMLAHM